MSWTLGIMPLLVCKLQLDFKTRLLKSHPRSLLLPESEPTWKTAGVELGGQSLQDLPGSPLVLLWDSL